MATRPRTEDLFRGSPPTSTSAPGADTPAPEKTAGQLVKEVTEDISTLVRKEIELAKQEVGSSVAAKAKGAAILAVVAVLGFFALIFFLMAIRDGYDEFLWTWVADIATGLTLLVIGGLAALVAKKKLATPISTELTKQNVKEDVDLMKSLGKR
jgi:hypothetical protein